MRALIPNFLPYLVLKDKEGSEKSEWIKEGVAWEYGDKDGLNLSLTLLGQQIPVVVHKNKPKE